MPLQLQFDKECGIGKSMLSEKKIFLAIFGFIFILAFGLSLFTNISALQKNFLFADEATYFMMTDSLAKDFDIEYTRHDLIRYYQSFDAGPKGIFLKKGKEGKCFYAKSAAYPVFAAPFVRILGANGFLVFHAILLLLVLLMGFYVAVGRSQPSLAFLSIFTFVFASVAAVYYLWLSPDFFNFFLVFAVLFLWLFKFLDNSAQEDPQAQSRIKAFLNSNASDYAACALVGLAVFSKPPNIVLLGPLVLFTLLNKQFLKALGMILVFCLVSFIFWGTNLWATGEWNYQGGERKTFYGAGGYPLEKEHLTFDNARGLVMTSEGYAEKHRYYPRVYIANLTYYIFGRFAGIAWYFFPALMALFLFFARKKQLFQWLVLITLAGEILIYILLMPDNYAGGGGALANRYFLSIYPLFFFLIPGKFNLKELGITWVVAAIFIAQILVNPLSHSHFPATHAKKFPLKLMPVELTLINNLPTNTNPAAHRQSMGTKYTWLYFLDDNFIPRTISQLERNGFWTRGNKKAEMIMKTFYPIKEITFRLHNNPRKQNEITVKFAGEKKKVSIGYKQWESLSFTPKKVFRMNEWIHLYKISIQAAKGAIPHFEEDDSTERRFLGVYFEVDIIPEYMPD